MPKRAATNSGSGSRSKTAKLCLGPWVDRICDAVRWGPYFFYNCSVSPSLCQGMSYSISEKCGNLWPYKFRLFSHLICLICIPYFYIPPIFTIPRSFDAMKNQHPVSYVLEILADPATFEPLKSWLVEKIPDLHLPEFASMPEDWLG